jgi:hypothetical protein
VRRAEEKAKQFAKRRYCSQEHFRASRDAIAKAREDAASKRKCAGCGKPLVRKRYGDLLEVITTFEARKYCDLECARARNGNPTRRKGPAPLTFDAPPRLVNADTGALLREVVRFHGEEFIRALEEAGRPDAARTVPWTQYRA